MEKRSLIIDNTGFDIAAMSAITEKQFIDIHKDTDAICRGKSSEEKEAWLKNAYASIKAAAMQDKKPDAGKESKPEETK